MSQRIRFAASALGALCLWGSSTLAWALPPDQEQQVLRLLDKVAASDCTFVRNGADHSAAEAAKHLRRKLNAARDRVQTASDFITHVASKSSVTGQAYQVRCPGQATQPAQTWLETLNRS